MGNEPLNIAEARSELQKVLRIFRAAEHADKVLAVLENVEQVEGERRAAAAQADAGASAAKAALEAASADLAAAKDEAKRVRKEAKAKAEDMVSKAEADAKKATTEAQGRVDALRAEADAVIALMLEKQNELSGLEEKLAEANATIEKAERLKAAMAVA